MATVALRGPAQGFTQKISQKVSVEHLATTGIAVWNCVLL